MRRGVLVGVMLRLITGVFGGSVMGGIEFESVDSEALKGE